MAGQRKKVEKRGGPGTKPAGLLAWAWRSCALAALAVICPAVAVLVACGMLPGLVAAWVDDSEDGSVASTVGALNAAAVAPFLPTVWMRGSSGPSASGLLPDVFTLLVIYAGAALGWVLVSLVPPCFEAVENSLVGIRCQRLRQLQADLVEEWGPEVGKPERAAEEPLPAGPLRSVNGRDAAR